LATKYYHQNQHELIVFNIRKNTVIAERNGLKSTIFSNDSILKNIDKSINLKSYLIGNFNKISNKNNVPSLLIFNNKKILILDSIAIYPTKIAPDLVIITKSPKLNLERFLQNCKPKLIIADASNYKSYVKIWKKTCFNQNIKFHSVSEKGFYRLK
jgi:competence protein ComEC